ncbi:MAG: DUF6912 family protein [Propionibacteriaceae bacterium]
MLICVPLTRAELDSLLLAPLSNFTAYAPTPSLYEGLGYTADMDEDADFAALTYASVASLLAASQRLVVVAQATANDHHDSFGKVTVASLAWSQVTGIFLDEPEVAPQVAAARKIAEATSSLADLWEHDAVQKLLEVADLLWYSPDEISEIRSRLLP